MVRSLFCLTLALLALSAPARAQDSTLAAHTVPFGSAEHRLTLTVANTGLRAVARLVVRPEQAPGWLVLTPAEVVLTDVEAGAEIPARFSFRVAPESPVGSPGEVVFTVEGAGGDRWQKRVRVQVSAPERVRLLPASPNPFNPTTRLAYELPAPSEVRLRLYNVLGQEVARLVERSEGAGRHEAVVDGASLPSGLYIARLAVTSPGRATAVETRRLMLLK